jgi:hypothetical protein
MLLFNVHPVHQQHGLHKPAFVRVELRHCLVQRWMRLPLSVRGDQSKQPPQLHDHELHGFVRLASQYLGAVMVIGGTISRGN